MTTTTTTTSAAVRNAPNTVQLHSARENVAVECAETLDRRNKRSYQLNSATRHFGRRLDRVKYVSKKIENLIRNRYVGW